MMSLDKRPKRFRDNIHGYIVLPKPLAEQVVDSELFQRLRDIEQTGMRALFPAARHDRFIHSLGVFHLGDYAFNCFHNQTDSYLQDCDCSNKSAILERLTPAWWERMKFLFTTACLLHDIAHAPFSHTLESIYGTPKWDETEEFSVRTEGYPDCIQDYCKRGVLPRLDKTLMEIYNNPGFHHDFIFINKRNKPTPTGKEHERLSAVTIWQHLRLEIESAFIDLEHEQKALSIKDFEFMARAIIGCQYRHGITALGEIDRIETSVSNCLINLLNNTSFGIDVDNLDYIVRDSKNSGYNNMSIDYARFFNSITVAPVYQHEDLKNHSLGKQVWFEGTQYKSSSTTCSETETIQKGETARFNDEKADIITGYSTKASSKDQPIYALTTCFRLSCLNVFGGIIDARNNLYKWIYSHQKVLYNTSFLKLKLLFLCAKYFCCKANNPEVFTDTSKEILSCLDKRNTACEKDGPRDDVFLGEILSLDMFLSEKDNCTPQNLGKGLFKTTFSSDSDINHLFKRIAIENAELENTCEEIERFWRSYSGRNYDSSFWKTKYELIQGLNIKGNDEEKYDEIFRFTVDGAPYNLLHELELTDLSISSSKIFMGAQAYRPEDPVSIELAKLGIKDPVIVLDNAKTNKPLEANHILVLSSQDDKSIDLLTSYFPQIANDASCHGNSNSVSVDEKPFIFLYGTFDAEQVGSDYPSMASIMGALREAAIQRIQSCEADKPSSYVD